MTGDALMGYFAALAVVAFTVAFMGWLQKRSKIRYCHNCGRAFVRTPYDGGFHSGTGKPVVRSWWGCPSQPYGNGPCMRRSSDYDFGKGMHGSDAILKSDENDDE